MGKKKKETQEQPSFEELMGRLEEIATELESGELGLEKAIERYEEGVTCYKLCHRILTGAEKKVEILTRKGDGELEAEPFEEEPGAAGENETAKDCGEKEESSGSDKDEGKSLF
jgi:exodeoxyribonuclease VII small subunit